MTDRPNSPAAAADDPWERISVVFVVHNSTGVLRQTIENVRNAHEIIMIDNQSSDGTADLAESLCSDIQVIRRNDNLGLTIASNDGFRRATKEYVLHINPDTKFDDDCIRKLVAAMDANPNAAVAGPFMVNGHGTPEMDVQGPGEIRHAKLAVDPDGPFCTWFVTGAICLWRTSVLQKLGGFDENIFLYYEDSDLCTRCVEAGHPLLIEPAARARHDGGQSGGISMKSRWRKDWNMAWGQLYYECKHGDPETARAEGRRRFWKHVGGVLGGILTFRRKRIVGQLARACGTRRFLKGGPSWNREGLS